MSVFNNSKVKPLELDGCEGEGGGQLVRICVALSAVTGTPIRIVNVRGNRPSNRGGGLKAQHVSGIQFLADATQAHVSGLEVGSKTLSFFPQLPPTSLESRKIQISAATPAASSMLIFQAIFPFLLFAANEKNEPIEVELLGGTNVMWSLSYEYLDQVLLPTLQDWFGIHVSRKLEGRGWSMGPSERGSVHLTIQPMPRGKQFKLGRQEAPLARGDFEVKEIDVSIITPCDLHELLHRQIASNLETMFPNAKINFILTEDSGHGARLYVLLVARSDRLRWGRDVLFSKSRKGTNPSSLSSMMSAKVCSALHKEVETGGVVDEFAQDQLIVFQSLAEGRSGFPRPDGLTEEEEEDESGSSLTGTLEALTDLRVRVSNLKRVKKTVSPFGQGSKHTKTARWVASEVLPGIIWYNDGSICEGVGIGFEK